MTYNVFDGTLNPQSNSILVVSCAAPERSLLSTIDALFHLSADVA